MDKKQNTVDALEHLKSIAMLTETDEFNYILKKGIEFAKKAEKFEKELQHELDQKVKIGMLTEHEARWKFYEKFNEFTEKDAHEVSERIIGNRVTKLEEEDDDPDEAIFDCDDDSESEEDEVEETEDEDDGVCHHSVTLTWHHGALRNDEHRRKNRG